MADYRKDIKTRMDAISATVSVISRRAEIHSQTLYNFLNGGEMKTKTLSAISDVLTEMENEFEREIGNEKEKEANRKV